ncbi:MAG TPA: hypothetical protein VGD30_08735 [Telluria sp.]
MSKIAPEKTNGHHVDAIPAVAQKVAARPLSKAAPAKAAPAKGAPVKEPARPALKAAPKTPAKAAPKPAAKAAAKPAVKAKPAAAKKAATPAPKAPAKAAAKTAAKAAKPVGKATARAARKPAQKPAAKDAPKASQAALERDKTRKPKLVRDSFTMPEEEYAVLALVKKACLKAGFEIKKSELLRVGVALISQIDMATLRSVLASLPQLKTGRPKNS